MTNTQSNLPRFAGPALIQESDHLSGLPQVQTTTRNAGRQAEQGGSNRSNKKGSRVQSANEFEYQNPRQYS